MRVLHHLVVVLCLTIFTSADIASSSHASSWDASGIRTSSDGIARLMDRVGGLPTLVAENTHTYVTAGDFAARVDSTGATSMLSDPTGSITHLVDSTGTVVGTSTYGAFGERHTSGEASAPGFVGEEHDPSGLVHLRARTYAPELGRFLQHDPLLPGGSDALSWGSYTYANNNPLAFSDPTGLFAASNVELQVGASIESDLQTTNTTGAWATARLILQRLQVILHRAASSRIGQCLAANVPDTTNETAADVAIDLASGCVDEVIDVARRTRHLLSRVAPQTTSWVDDATAPIGRRGSPIEIAPGTNSPATIGGRQYTGHALDRMQGRGIMPSAVDDTIATSRGVPGADGSIIHYSPANNISVVLNADGSVRTVSYGVFKPR